MFWVRDRRSGQLYKVFGTRPDKWGHYMDFYVFVDEQWLWINSRYCEPTEPALYTMHLVDDEFDRKFTHYYVGDE